MSVTFTNLIHCVLHWAAHIGAWLVANVLDLVQLASCIQILECYRFCTININCTHPYCYQLTITLPTDHPIHPPSTEGDPFEVDFPDDLNCVLKTVQGVVHVYQSQEMFEKGEPIELPYPDRQTFLADMNKLMALIANGPM